MQETVRGFGTFLSEELPALIVPIAILIVGWLLALVLGALTRAGLRRTTLDERLARRMFGEERARKVDTGRWAGRAVYWIVLLFTLLAFLQSLQLTATTEPIGDLLGSVFAYLPRLVGAALIALVAWVVATVVRRLVRMGVGRLDIDRRLGAEPEPKAEPGAPPAEAEVRPVEAEAERPSTIGRTIAETSYWLVLLLFVPAVLGALGLEGLLSPVESMVNEVLAFLPNLASAAIILFVGWFVARILGRLTANVLVGLGSDRLSERIGLAKTMGGRPLSRLLGIVVQVLILIPVVIGALNALAIEAVTAPASAMLQTFFDALPRIFGAALVVAVAWVVGRLLATVVRSLLEGVGFDRILPRLGISARAKRTPSEVMGTAAMVVVVYFAAIEAAWLLGFDAVAEVAVDVAVLAGRIFLGLVIFAVGMFLANLAADAVRKSDVRQARLLSLLTRVSILVLAAAMALRQMGIADEIIVLAFGLAMGAVAVAAALAFGLGGRDAAARAIEQARGRLREEQTKSRPPGESPAE